jgi:hypothetical protein
MAGLVIGGPILQADKGIYAAQQEIFQSWVFLLFGVFPLPGMMLIGALLFVNLLCAVVFRLKYNWPGLGILLIHIGLLVLLGGGFISSQYAREYFLTLSAGESSQMANAAHEWELAVWTQAGIKKYVLAVDIADLNPGRPWTVPTFDWELTMTRFYSNCRPAGMDEKGEMILSETPPMADPAENIPGAAFEIASPQSGARQFSLFAGNNFPAALQFADRQYYFALRLKRIILPLRLKLLAFRKTVYPGSDIPKSFASLVEIESGGLRRQASISMNHPLRFREYTFYQSSYGEDVRTGVNSTFAVVKNAGRWLPYISSALIFLGLVLHFFSKLRAAQKKSSFEVR